MGLFDEEIVAAIVEAKSKEEIKAEIESNQEKVRRLKHYHAGDDGPYGKGYTVKDDRYFFKERIRNLKSALKLKT